MGFFLILSGPAAAQRKAFVVGISKYELDVLKLRHPANDANDFKEKLQKLGFDVSYFVPESKATLKGLTSAWGNFVKSLKRNDDVLVYFSGHGISKNNLAFLAPKDFNPSNINASRPLNKSLMSLSIMLENVATAFPRTSVWIIDACRDNKLKVSDQQQGLKYSPVRLANTAILYATSETWASFDVLDKDAAGERNSVYTRGLLREIDSHSDVDIYAFSGLVSRTVSTLASPQVQVPESRLNMIANWCFGQCPVQVENIVFENSVRKVEAITTAQLQRKKSVVKETISKNAILLGKDTGDRCDAKDVGLHPFGCDVLDKLASASKFDVNLTLAAQTNVYRHRYPPKVVEQVGVIEGAARKVATLKYDERDCRVGSVVKGEQVEIVGFLKFQSVLTDATGREKRQTAYWGILPEKKTCPSKRVEKNLVAKITSLNLR